MRRRLNVTYLQKFGIKAYVLDQTSNKNKFAPKGIEGIFIGYSEISKAYVESPGSTTTIEGEIGGNNVLKQVDHHDDLSQVESTGNRCNSPREDTDTRRTRKKTFLIHPPILAMRCNELPNDHVRF